ncbi:FecR domain-containing protein [Winogradskyella sp. 3972H.M.0a.05]|uniref:FecR family protein n=1 Tax=Winogradskyella sp. 3972H.M.0a.05 TaxID=2950277 RepID=UPI003391F771
MNREDLIQKWLDNNLNANELEAFKQLEDYDALMKLSNGLAEFKAPEYNTSEELDIVLSKLDTENSTKSINFFKPLMRIAAVLVICFSAYYYTTTLDTKINTDIAQKTSVFLPDQSEVQLNAESSMTYNENDWDEERSLLLEGEAFFKVAKGETFSVNTSAGIVSVLGTEFNVRQRNNIFEVICYEGLVAVTYDNEKTKLYPGDTFLIVNGKRIVNEKENNQQPTWITNESSFRSIPFSEVIAELERQYDVSVAFDQSLIDAELLFTGRFTHNNLDIALKSITLPLNLGYQKTDNSIILTRG